MAQNNPIPESDSSTELIPYASKVNNSDKKLFDEAYLIALPFDNRNAIGSGSRPQAPPLEHSPQPPFNQSGTVKGYISMENPYTPRPAPAPMELNPIYAASQPVQQERFARSFYGCRPDGLDSKIASSLTEADMRTLTRLESAFLQGNVPELAKLVDSVRPQREGYNAGKEYFSHALEVFRTELYSMGFDVTYNRQTGALSIINQEKRSTGHAYLKSLVIDPSIQTVVAERVGPSNQSRDRISFNWGNKQMEEFCTQFHPEFKQFSRKAAPEQFDSKYLDLLRDKIDLHFEHVRHEKLAAQNERYEKALQEQSDRDRKLQEEYERRERDIRLGITPRSN